MIKLNPDELSVTTYATEPGDGGEVGPGDNTTGTETELMNTDPRACPRTQGWDCYTYVTVAVTCETAWGANC